MKNFLSSIRSLFSDENGIVSMKRLCGLICTITLCTTLYVNALTNGNNMPSTTLIDAVAMLAFGCLGLSSIDKIFGKKQKQSEDETTPPDAQG